MVDLSGIEQRQINLTRNQTPKELVLPTENALQAIKANGNNLDEVMIGVIKGTYSLNGDVDKRLLRMQLAAADRQNTSQSEPIDELKSEKTDWRNKRSELLNLVHSIADMVVTGRKSIEALGDDIWDKSDYEIWEALHQGIFGTADISAARKQYPDSQVRAFHLGFLRFLDHFETVKTERRQAIENPPDFIKKCFKTKLANYELKHQPAIEVTPLAIIAYLHHDDYQVVHETGFVKGGYVGVLEDYPSLSHRVIIVNTDEAEPKEGKDDFRVERTRQHELQHAFYYVFFKEYDIEALEKYGSEASADRFNPDRHAATSRFLRQYFLEHEKNEAISYNYDPLQINEEAGGERLYQEFVEGGKTSFAQQGADEATQDRLDRIYKDDYQKYIEERELLKGAINMIYGNAQQLGVSKDHIESLLQITPVTKIIRTIKSVMGIQSQQEMRDAVREYQLKPIREMEARMREEQEQHRKIMEVLETLRDEEE